jgi:carbonic anhydrase
MTVPVRHFGWAVTCAVTVAAGLLQTVLGLSRVRCRAGHLPRRGARDARGISVTIALAERHVLLGGAPGTRA